MLARLLPNLKRLLPGSAASSDTLRSEAPALRSDTSPWEGGPQLQRLVWAFIWLGVAARAVRYFLCFPLWEDECFLSYNLIDRGYADLLRPLDYHQVAPVLFLWLQLSVVKLLGFSEWALRLIPFVCGVASVFLFQRLAAKLTSGLALLCAVAVFSVSYPGIRYAAEAKPYGTDLFVGLLLVSLFVSWSQAPQRLRPLWWLVALAPLAIGLSYPAPFVCGGVSLAIAWCLVRDRAAHGKLAWVAWGAFNVGVLAAFAVTYLLAAANQSGAELDFMQAYWGHAFPPLDSLGHLLAWFGVTHVSDLAAYPVGGGRGASAMTGICCLVAVIALARKRRGTVLLLAGTPLLLNLIAAALHRYPYGGHVKFAQYHAAMICLLAGIGLAAILQAHAKWIPARGKLGVQMALALLAVIAGASIARDVTWPYKSTTDMRHRAFAQWFWFNTEFQGETVCLAADLDVRFSQETYADLSWSAMYFCNQRIYSPRKIAGRQPDWQRISTQWPLRCVLFRAPRFDFDEPAHAAWLADMQMKYRLESSVSYPFPCFGKHEGEAINVDYVQIETFVPLQDSLDQSPAVAQR